MKKVFTAKEMEAYLATGATACQLPSDVVLTPSARDVIRARKRGSTPTKSTSSATGGSNRFPPLTPGVPSVPPEPMVPNFEYSWEPGTDPKTPEEIQRFFYSPEIQELKEQIAHVGHKMWARSMVDGNGGNITVRVGDNLVLCTPTLRSKGELLADEIALVDLDGNQKAGWRKRTSEVNTHIAIMKLQPEAKSVIHGHPPYSTAYAVAGIEPPTCLCSEAEIFTGPIRLVGYETPGSPENAKAVAEIGKDNPAILLANHGVMTWGSDVEDAYWKLENMETACQTVWVASQLNGGKVQTIPTDKMKELFDIRRSIGMVDPREGLRECELCDNLDMRPPTVCTVESGSSEGCGCGCSGGDDSNPQAEAAVREITEQILKHMGNS